MKVRELQKKLAELLLFIAENYPNSNEEIDNELSNKIYEIAYKTDAD